MRTNEASVPRCMSRRTALIAAATTMLSVQQLGLVDAQEDAKGTSELLSHTALSYRIEIAAVQLAFPIKTTHGFIHGRSPSPESLARYVPLFASEFKRYPREFVEASKLKKVILCEDLSFDGQRRNAVPDFEHNALYLDSKRGDHDGIYQRKVLHHEFFHIVDYVDDGEIYSDAQWSAMNPPDFRYGTGGRNAQDIASTSELTERFPGFLNHYSTTGVEEDKAELFANMLMDFQHVQQRALRDLVVAKKVEAMKKLLARFCKELDEKFWERVGKGR